MTPPAQRILEGDTRAVSRLATGIENRDPEALATLRELEAATGHARIVGITGAPGAGKSTLVDALAVELRRQGKTLAILAVDPSSRASGGAILGDRIRMQQHHADPGIFIRSMATRGTVGGLARATADLARLMDASGRDYVIIETVGVGQDEIEIASVAQVTVVVLVPGMGDDVQAIKAGIMEIADVFVINKSDRPGADRVELELQAEGFSCPILRTVATEGKGIAELVEAMGAVRCRQAKGPAQPSAPSIDHIGIAVQNLADSTAFWESLGLAVGHRETDFGERAEVAVLPAGGSRVVLLQPAGADSPIARFLELSGPGLHHLALRVPDLDAVVCRLRARGARLIEAPCTGAEGRHHAFVYPDSSGGILLELIQESTN